MTITFRHYIEFGYALRRKAKDHAGIDCLSQLNGEKRNVPRKAPYHAFTGHTQKNRFEYILEVTLSSQNLNYVGLIFQIGTILRAF